MVDGMPIVSGLGTVYGLNGIPSALIERMEVVKGAASTLYGSEGRRTDQRHHRLPTTPPPGRRLWDHVGKSPQTSLHRFSSTTRSRDFLA